MSGPLQMSFDVACPAEHAFSVWQSPLPHFMAAIGRFGLYPPPLLEVLGLAEVTHDARNNRMRAI
jgi:hypothetical protein